MYLTIHLYHFFYIYENSRPCIRCLSSTELHAHFRSTSGDCQIMSGSYQVVNPRAKSENYSLENDTDRISNLPDDLIGNILSRLPTEKAVATCVLSKDWEYKWTFIEKINICDSWKLENSTMFRKYVERILDLVRNATRIKLKVLYMFNHSNVTKSWMISLSRHVAEELDIHIKRECFVFSSTLLNLSKLRNLYLRGPIFEVSSTNQFLKLTSLHLYRVEVKNENGACNGKTVTFNFPVLETLKLDTCTWFDLKFVEIHAPLLNKFESRARWPRSTKEDDEYTISIHSTRIVYFMLNGNRPENFLLNGSVVEAVDVVPGCFDAIESEILQMSGMKVHSLLKQVSSSLKFLGLSIFLAEAILESEHGCSFLRFDILEWLYLISDYATTPYGTAAVLEFLRTAPSLKVLIIDLKNWIDMKYDVSESISSLVEVLLINYHDETPCHGLLKMLEEAGVTIKQIHVPGYGEVDFSFYF